MKFIGISIISKTNNAIVEFIDGDLQVAYGLDFSFATTGPAQITYIGGSRTLSITNNVGDTAAEKNSQFNVVVGVADYQRALQIKINWGYFPNPDYSTRVRLSDIDKPESWAIQTSDEGGHLFILTLPD